MYCRVAEAREVLNVAKANLLVECQEPVFIAAQAQAQAQSTPPNNTNTNTNTVADTHTDVDMDMNTDSRDSSAVSETDYKHSAATPSTATNAISSSVDEKELGHLQAQIAKERTLSVQKQRHIKVTLARACDVLSYGVRTCYALEICRTVAISMFHVWMCLLM